MSTAVDLIERRVIEIIADEFDRMPSQISRQTAFMADLDADSLDLAELEMILEEKLGVKIPDDDADAIATVGEAIDCIVRLRTTRTD